MRRPRQQPRLRSRRASGPEDRGASWIHAGIDELPRFREAYLRGGSVVARMRSHRKAMGRALVVAELDRPVGLANAFLELAHSFDRGLLVPGAVKDQRRDRDLLGKVVGLQPRPCAFGPER